MMLRFSGAVGKPEISREKEAAEMPKSKRGRKPKYDPVEICERSISIIKTLGVADCTKTAVAVAFYDSKFDPNKPGEKERLLSIGDKQGESAIARQRRRAKRISQRVSYLELLETNHCPEFEQLVAAVDGGMSEMGL